ESLALRVNNYYHHGETQKAVEIFADAIRRNPDNDQYYLSLALTELRAGSAADAEVTLRKGRERVPASGKILWGLGVLSALNGDSTRAAEQLGGAGDLLPGWAGSSPTARAFHYQT